MSKNRKRRLQSDPIDEPLAMGLLDEAPEEWSFALEDATREGFESWRNWSDELRPGRRRGRHGGKKRSAKGHPHRRRDAFDDDLPEWGRELAEHAPRGRHRGRRGHPVYF